MTRWLQRLIARIKAAIRNREISIRIGNLTINIKSEKDDPNLDTKKIKKDDRK